ncbi:L-rhamnose mutarotase [uncultured Draconibacterium sp.]|uniref:L-rhamnose mutarotase n=1 Tax=uncultured Draconibacterium sp. TaxID=1573823 RepID=UPI003216E160
MKRFGQTIKLKPDGAAEYIKHHAAVWPGVLAKIKACNLSNYSIFTRDNILFAYFEYTGSDFDADMAKMAAHEETQRWWDVVKPLMQPVDSAKADEFWADMEEIFHLE